MIPHNRRMTLPLHPTPPAAAPAPGRRRILVVDDDRLVLATLVQGLMDAGYEVFDADNGDDAILLAREHRPQLALLDIRMVGKSGFDVAHTLRDPKYGIPFMFLSAFADEATQRKVRALGALDYLIKPLDVDQIVPRVDAAFGRLSASGGGEPERAAAAAERAPGNTGTDAGAAGAEAGGAALAAPAAPTVSTPETVVTTTDPLSQPVALAVGVLMHRHGLTREAAWQQLRRLAAVQRQDVQTQAERLLGAMEELARSAP